MAARRGRSGRRHRWGGLRGGRRRRCGFESHPALRTRSGFRVPDVGVHRAHIDRLRLWLSVFVWGCRRLRRRRRLRSRRCVSRVVMATRLRGRADFRRRLRVLHAGGIGHLEPERPRFRVVETTRRRQEGRFRRRGIGGSKHRRRNRAGTRGAGSGGNGNCCRQGNEGKTRHELSRTGRLRRRSFKQNERARRTLRL